MAYYLYVMGKRDPIKGYTESLEILSYGLKQGKLPKAERKSLEKEFNVIEIKLPDKKKVWENLELKLTNPLFSKIMEVMEDGEPGQY